MKLVNYDEFIRMPAGTIFAPYRPCVLEEGLAIKTDHGWEYNGRWMFCGVMPLEPCNHDVIDEDSVKASFEIYDGDSNDYAEYDKFLVFDECDIDRLISVLQWAKNGCPDEHESFDEY